MLRDDVSEMPKNWNRRFKHNRDKIKTGDIYELAEVVRNLAIREHEKGLSTGEKQMFTRAKKILASELMYALEKDEDEAEEYLDDLLAESAGAKVDPGAGSSSLTAVALIVAAGRGERLGSSGPKAFVALAGRPMLEWSVAALRAAPAIGEIVVALPAEALDAAPGGLRRRSPAAPSARTRCGPRSRRRPPRRTSCSCTTRRGRCVTPELVARCLAALDEDGGPGTRRSRPRP